MNIGLIGYGRMGKEIEIVANERGHVIAAVFDIDNNAHGKGLTKKSLHGVDVCIEFSTPDTVIDNIEAVNAAGLNMVVGTTGWYDRLDRVREIVKQKKTGLIYASNFSLGVNLFTRIVQEAAKLFDRYPDYDVAIHEIHHRLKADSPSGTALSIGAAIVKGMKRKTEIFHETSHGAIKPQHLHITSSRLGAVTGKHAVTFDSEADTIELTHTAKSRRGFAVGAVVAAEWIKGKKGVYTMSDVISS